MRPFLDPARLLDRSKLYAQTLMLMEVSGSQPSSILWPAARLIVVSLPSPCVQSIPLPVCTNPDHFAGDSYEGLSRILILSSAILRRSRPT